MEKLLLELKGEAAGPEVILEEICAFFRSGSGEEGCVEVGFWVAVFFGCLAGGCHGKGADFGEILRAPVLEKIQILFCGFTQLAANNPGAVDSAGFGDIRMVVHWKKSGDGDNRRAAR